MAQRNLGFSVALVLVAPAPSGLAVSLLLVGLLTPGIVILTSGALALTAPPDRFPGLWATGAALSVAVLGLAATRALIAARRAEIPDQRPIRR